MQFLCSLIFPFVSLKWKDNLGNMIRISFLWFLDYNWVCSFGNIAGNVVEALKKISLVEFVSRRENYNLSRVLR